VVFDLNAGSLWHDWPNAADFTKSQGSPADFTAEFNPPWNFISLPKVGLGPALRTGPVDRRQRVECVFRLQRLIHVKKLVVLFGACFILSALEGVANAQVIYYPGRDCTPSRAVWLGGYYSYPYAYYPYGYG
jgi:hypothetical protein